VVSIVVSVGAGYAGPGRINSQVLPIAQIFCEVREKVLYREFDMRLRRGANILANFDDVRAERCYRFATTGAVLGVI